jgi:isopentenyl-diphosphate delta-isomerase
MSAQKTRRVSFDDEPLIVVDEDNNVLEFLPKADVHRGEGILHRAFSVFLFNEAGQVLLQQRSADKPLWPLYWSNSCCSHPRRGETEAEAAVRRIAEELGVETELEYVYTFTYHAPFGEAGSEREVCSVFLGRCGEEVRANENEIAAWRWIDAAELTRELESNPDDYTPWFKMEWARLRDEFGARLGGYAP